MQFRQDPAERLAVERCGGEDGPITGGATGRRSFSGALGQVTLTLVVALLASFGIAALNRYSDDRRQVQIALIRTSAELSGVSSIEDRYVQDLIDPEVRTAVSARLHRVESWLAELDRWAAGEPELVPVRDGATRYVALVGELFKLRSEGRIDEAAELDDALVDPVFDELRAQIDQHVSAADEAARRSGLASQICSVLLVVLGCLVQLTLFTRYQRARQAAAMLAMERAARRDSHQRLSALVGNAADVILVCDGAGLIRYLSPAAERSWGYVASALIQTPLAGLVHPDDQDVALALLRRAADQPSSSVAAELRLAQADGTWRDFEVIANNLLSERRVDGIVVTCHDITERKLYEQRLERLAFSDTLTGLPNRTLLTDRLGQALARAARIGRQVGLICIDVDNFKVVNDSLGHFAGDRLLVLLAERLRACVRQQDTVARLGGDEFIVLVEDADGESELARVAERIIAALRTPVVLGGRDVFCTVSLGIALSPPGLERADVLLRNVDLALYQAKAAGKGRYAAFDTGMDAGALERFELEADLHHAIERDELELQYQPIVALAGGQIVEFEALVRWLHPIRGLITPDRFIPIAEESGLIEGIGGWVLEAACRQAVEWQRQHSAAGGVTISVNLSPRQFRDQGLVAKITSVLVRTGLRPASLKLEITENVIMDDAGDSINKLLELRSLGIQLAIDDFGTGYSSLSSLKRLPIDTLKIDRSFVAGLSEAGQDAAIIRSIIALARSLELSVTGEGIETPEQLAHLRTLGCDRGQGYFFARPLSVEAATALLRDPSDRSQPAA